MTPITFSKDSLFFRFYLMMYSYLPLNSCELIKKSILLLIFGPLLLIWSFPLFLLTSFKVIKTFIAKTFFPSDVIRFNLVYFSFISLLFYVILYLFIAVCYFIVFIFSPHLEYTPFEGATIAMGILTFIVGVLIYLAQLLSKLVKAKKNRRKSKTEKQSNLKSLFNSIKDKTCFTITFK